MSEEIVGKRARHVAPKEVRGLLISFRIERFQVTSCIQEAIIIKQYYTTLTVIFVGHSVAVPTVLKCHSDTENCWN